MFFFFKQKTAYEMRISDWSSDVCSSDLHFAEDATAALALTAMGAGVCVVPASLAAIHWPGVRFTPLLDDAVGSPIVCARSEERRVGKECVSTCRSRWSPYP